MSKPRYGWWSYAKDMIRRYPQLKAQYADLHTINMTASYSGMPGGGGSGRTLERASLRELPRTSQREYEAVRMAIDTTERYGNGKDRLAVIDAVLWKRSHTVDGASLTVSCSNATARRWHGEFIKQVAKNFGLLDY